MKRILCVLLLTALLLCGCKQKLYPDPSSMEDLTLVIQDGTVAQPHDWNSFLCIRSAINMDTGQRVDFENTISITIRTGETQTQAALHYADGVYTMEDASGTRSYTHLWRTLWSEGNEVREICALSNDADITLADLAEAAGSVAALQPGQYIDQLDAQIVYLDTMHFSRGECYGQVPEDVQKLIDEDLLDQAKYCEHSLFYREYNYTPVSEDALAMESVTYRRYSYSGELLCTFQTEQTHDAIQELPDGGFLMCIGNVLYAYDPDGSVRWVYSYPYEQLYSGCANQMLLLSDGIYTFGEIKNPDDAGKNGGDSDILVCKLSYDGALLQEHAFRGSDFDDLYRAELTNSGFVIYGSTQSSDGDFPLSEDGYGVDFCAKLGFDLQLSSLRPYEWELRYAKGYHSGKEVFGDDSLLQACPEDILPQDIPDEYYPYLGVSGVFDTEYGYVIVRFHALAEWKLNPVLRSARGSYTELIVTGYSHGGEPLWQTTTPVFTT